jgi:TRAP-type transport system small permease protein
LKSSKTKILNKTVDFLLKWLQIIFNGAAILALLAIAAVVLYQIFARYMLPKAPVWTEELSRYLFIYAIILASGTVIIKRRHMRLELFHHRLSQKGMLIYNSLCHLLVTVFCLWLLPHAWKYAAIGSRQTSPAMGLNMSWMFASTFIFFTLVALTSLLLATKDILSILADKEA